MLRDNPAATVTIGWNQISGKSAVVYYGTEDFGTDWRKYKLAKSPDRTAEAKGMVNCFARLKELKANTVYYFIVKDNEGASKRFWFKTMPESATDARLSIVAGGDSRNHQKARRNANLLVAKLRPDVVMFGGDMTFTGTDEQWEEWFDDWQLTAAPDGRMTPVIACRGNHEADNKILRDLFDLPNEDAYYAITFCGNLLRFYTLNTLIPIKGEQTDWLKTDLEKHKKYTWRIAQYHYPMHPHTSRKKEREDEATYWAPLFYKYRVQLAIECDAHLVKYTWPIKPGKGACSELGFVRDDERGTTYIGEGGWGAPLRPNNDDKVWTRASGSFNQFHLIFLDKNTMEVRTVKTDYAEKVTALKEGDDRYALPANIQIWKPPTGETIVIKPK